MPVPAQVGQTSTGVPGSAPLPRHRLHGASPSKFTEVVVPRTASSNGSVRTAAMSAPRWGAAPGGSSKAEQIAEIAARATEQILDSDLAAGSAEPASACTLEGTGAHGSDLVVLLALLGIGQHRVRLGDFLEAFGSLVVVGVGIRMQLLGQLPVRLLDLVVVGALGHLEGLVEILVEPVTIQVMPPCE